MNRPCFALSILFAALTGSLLVVGSAKSQTGVDSADASRAASPAAVGQCTPPEAGRCVVQAAPADDASLPEDYSRYLDDYRYYLDGFDSRSRQWTMVAPTPIESVATTATASERTIPLRSEHDTTYDQAVYGPALPVAAEVAEKVAVEVTAGGERQPSYEEAEMPFEHVYDCYEYGYAATPDPEAGFSDRAQPQTAVDVAASAGQASNYEDGYDGCYDAYSYEDWSYEDYSSEDYSDEYTYEDNWYESYTYEDYGYEPAVAEVDAADEAEGEAPAAVADAEVERSPCNGYSDDDAYLCECQ